MSFGLINSRNQPRRAAAVGVILVAELRAQQPLFRAYARDERRDEQRREQHAESRTKGERPSQRTDQQSQITGMTDDAIDPARDQRMPWLDRDQSAEATAEHEHRPDPQRTTRDEENDAEPADGITVESPEVGAVGVGRQIGQQQPDQPESREHPAIATVLALAGTEISAAE